MSIFRNFQKFYRIFAVLRGLESDVYSMESVRNDGTYNDRLFAQPRSIAEKPPFSKEVARAARRRILDFR